MVNENLYFCRPELGESAAMISSLPSVLPLVHSPFPITCSGMVVGCGRKGDTLITIVGMTDRA